MRRPVENEGRTVFVLLHLVASVRAASSCRQLRCSRRNSLKRPLTDRMFRSVCGKGIAAITLHNGIVTASVRYLHAVRHRV
jgi:hypothetical protein